MPGLTRRRALAALAAAAAWAGTAPVAGARPFDDVKESGVLRIAIYRDNAPFSDEVDGKLVGIDVDLARAVAAKIGVTPEVRLIDASENVDGDMRLTLWRGDLAGSALADLMLHVPADKQLEIRNEQVFFTVPYVEQRLAVAYKTDTFEGGFQGVSDLEGRTIAVEGTGPADLLIQFAENGRFRTGAHHFRTFADAAKAFFDGEADVLSGSKAAVEGAIAARKADGYEVRDLTAQGPIRPRWELCGAVRSNSRDLGYAIGEAMTGLIASGEMKTLFAAHGVSFAAPQGY